MCVSLDLSVYYAVWLKNVVTAYLDFVACQTRPEPHNSKLSPCPYLDRSHARWIKVGADVELLARVCPDDIV